MLRILLYGLLFYLIWDFILRPLFAPRSPSRNSGKNQSGVRVDRAPEEKTENQEGDYIDYEEVE